MSQQPWVPDEARRLALKRDIKNSLARDFTRLTREAAVPVMIKQPPLDRDRAREVMAGSILNVLFGSYLIKKLFKVSFRRGLGFIMIGRIIVQRPDTYPYWTYASPKVKKT